MYALALEKNEKSKFEISAERSARVSSLSSRQSYFDRLNKSQTQEYIEKRKK